MGRNYANEVEMKLFVEKGCGFLEKATCFYSLKKWVEFVGSLLCCEKILSYESVGLRQHYG